MGGRRFPKEDTSWHGVPEDDGARGSESYEILSLKFNKRVPLPYQEQFSYEILVISFACRPGLATFICDVKLSGGVNKEIISYRHVSIRRGFTVNLLE
uniref:Uncharacterized protein n=1 Tax=Trichuris muris TaxID=70415 RepID=A0A5S6QEF1_TRIMR